MSHNPYQAPGQNFGSAPAPFFAPQRIKPPAISLMVVTAICLLLLLLAMVLDIFILVRLAGLDATAVPGVESRMISTAIRLAWSLIMVICQVFIVYSMFQMLNFRNLKMVRAGLIMAIIPCIGPCFILGIPFAIWGLIVLREPNVTSQFR